MVYKRPHSLLQGHLEYAMHTFDLTSPKVSISPRFPMQKACSRSGLIFISCSPRQIVQKLFNKL